MSSGDSSIGKKLSNGLTIAITPVLVTGVIAIFTLITKYRRMLRNPTFTARFGALCEGQNPKSKIGAYWTVLILLRLTLTVFIMLVMRDFGQLQIQMLFAISLIA